jgi:hypothetical protein
MSDASKFQSVALPPLFDSDEPVFLTEAQPVQAVVAAETTELSFDGTGDIHDTIAW